MVLMPYSKDFADELVAKGGYRYGGCLGVIGSPESGKDIYFQKKLTPQELTNNPGIFQKITQDGCRGNKYAFWNYAACFDVGFETNQNWELARYYYLLSAYQNMVDRDDNNSGFFTTIAFKNNPAFYQDAYDYQYPSAALIIGMCYLQGDGVPENDTAANRYFSEAIQRGSIFALDVMGGQYAHGYGVPVDMEKARELFKKAYEKGDLSGTKDYLASLQMAGDIATMKRVINELREKGINI